VTEAGGGGPYPADRAGVERTVRDLVLGVVQGQVPTGVSIVVEGAPGIGKTFLAQAVVDAIAPGAAKVRRVAGRPGQRHDPFGAAGSLLAEAVADGDLGDAAFDRVDELCADGPVVLWADDAHYLDAASLTLLRRLVWASRDLPLAVLIGTRPYPSREPLDMLVRQAQVRLRLPPMGPMSVERVVYDQTGRWPGPRLRRVLGLAAGNPLFVTELLRAYRHAGALADAGADTIEARFELDLRATGLDEVIRAQLAQLDEPVRDLLAVMSVWGTDVGADALARLLPGQPAGELTERAIASGLIRREPAGTAGFSHDLFREVTYAGLAEPRRRATHRQVAELLAADGYRPALVAEHLARAAGTGGDPALVAALHDAVAATRGPAAEVTADLLDDIAAISRADLPDQLLLDRADALFHRGRGMAAEALIRERIATVTDPAIAARLQLILLRSLNNRADVAAGLAAFDRTLAIDGLPDAARRQLEGSRAFLLAQAGRAPAVAEQDAMMARFTAAGDKDAQANLLGTMAISAFLDGHPDRALEFLRTRDEFVPGQDSLRARASVLFLPAVLELARSGPPAARAALERARRLISERHAEWLDPFTGFVAGGIALGAGDWDDAVAELDAALERAEETGTGWISVAVGLRAYIDAHRGDTAAARARLESFRHRGLPLHYGHDRPGWAELAVLEAEGAIGEAATLARTLWSATQRYPGRWAADLAPDVTRVALARMDRRLAGQIGDEVTALCPPEVAGLVLGMLAADPDAIEAAAATLAGAGRHTAEAFAREEVACAAAAAGDRDRASAALDAALAWYRRMGAVPDRDRALGRLRALGVRRGSREAHRGADFGWASLTVTENRIAGLVRDGLTNREIGTRLFVSPRTVQTHVSHILQKTGLRSRVEIARAVAEA
jgi:DNA-binding CsgD family transcriptional regulator/tetratricopeptide (TPR) repeat protein